MESYYRLNGSKSKMLLPVVMLSLCLNHLPTALKAQLALTAANTAFTISFDTTVAGVCNGQYAGGGFTPAPATGQLNSEAWAVSGFSDGTLAFGGSLTTGDHARGYNSTGVTTGGLYSFGIAPPNRTFGIQPTGTDFTPGSFTLKVVNATGQDADSIRIAYTLYVRNNGARGNYVNPLYSLDDINYTGLPSLNYTSPAAITGLDWLPINRDTVIAVNWPDSGAFYLRWTGGDVSGGGDRDEFAWDDISITAIAGINTIATGPVAGSPFCLDTAALPVMVPFTSSGAFDTANHYIVELSDATGSFASPTVLDSIASTLNADSIWTSIPAGTPFGTGYRIRIVSTAPAVTGENNGTDIIISTQVAASLATTHVDCFGNTNGSIMAAVSEGVPPCTYNWSDGATTTQIAALPGGVYSLTVTDSVGCWTTLADTVFEPAEIVLSAEIDDATCHGDTDGGIDLTVEGGTQPYTFLWSNAGNTEDIPGLSAGSYNIVVTDNNGCSDSATYQVSEPAALTYTANITNESCGGYEDGSIAITDLPGVLFTFLWSSGSTDSELNSLSAGQYSVTITDLNGCETLDTFEVEGPPAAEVAFSITAASCEQCADGSIAAQATGGTSPYTYSWSNGQTTPAISNLVAGVYTLSLTDSNGCEYAFTATVEAVVGIAGAKGEPRVHIYPNPFTDGVTVALSVPGEEVEWKMYDVSGRLVLYGSATGDTGLLIETGSLKTGVYHVEIRDTRGRCIARELLIKGQVR